MAHGRVNKKAELIQYNAKRLLTCAAKIMFLTALTDGELQIFTGMAFQICAAAQLKVRRPIDV